MSEEEPVVVPIEEENDLITRVLLKVIQNKRKAFYNKAIELGLITREQKLNLMMLHVLVDAQQRAKDQESAEEEA